MPKKLDGLEDRMEIISVKQQRDKLREIYENLHGKAFGEFSGVASEKATKAAAHVKAAIDELEGLE